MSQEAVLLFILNFCFELVTKHKHNSDFLLLVDKSLENLEMGIYVVIMMYYLGGNLIKITAHLKLKVGENAYDKIGFNPFFGCSSMRQHSCFKVLRYVHVLSDPIIPLSSPARLPLHICIHLCVAISLLLRPLLQNCF